MIYALQWGNNRRDNPKDTHANAFRAGNTFSSGKKRLLMNLGADERNRIHGHRRNDDSTETKHHVCSMPFSLCLVYQRDTDDS